MHARITAPRGMTFIDVLVGSALITIMFTGIIAGFRYSIELIALSRGQQGALSIASDQLERMRALPYAVVGTTGGIPPGPIPQVETVTLNDITYTKRVLVQYVDAPEDGLDSEDENGITADYKRARVEVSWTSRGNTHEEVLITNIVPKGVETTAGGGTIRVTVFDSLAQPVADAAVRVVHASTSPAIDVTTYTNAEGTVLFSGAPAASGYQILATKEGYSTAQTYETTPANTNPNPAHVSVLESQTSGLSFAIDRLSTLMVRTFEPAQPATTTVAYADASEVATSTAITVSGGTAHLAQEGAGFASFGSLYSTPIAPPAVNAWTAFRESALLPPSTSITYQFYTGDESGYVLIPEAVLPGNSAGFVSGPIDLSGIDAEEYASIVVAAHLATQDTATTPELDAWSITYEAGAVPLSNIGFVLQGTKIIGSGPDGEPVYKYDATHDSGASGEVIIDQLEWDTYTIMVDAAAEGYDIASVCPIQPLSLAPGTVLTADVSLVPHTAASLQVVVTDLSGAPLSGADVQLSRIGYVREQMADSCGQTIFTALADEEAYMLDTAHPGYLSDSQEVTTDGNGTIVIKLTPSS